MKLDFRFIITYSDGTQSVLPLKDGQTGLEDLYTGAYFSREDCSRGRICGITLKPKAVIAALFNFDDRMQEILSWKRKKQV